MGSASPDDAEHEPVTEPTGDDSGAHGVQAGSSRRDIVVPLSLYKVVITFSTLLAILGVVAGFITLDAATRRASAPASSIDPLLVLLGLGFIAGGGLIYVFAARFRTAGMGTDKTEAGEQRDDG